jgi:hypothetical protein
MAMRVAKQGLKTVPTIVRPLRGADLDLRLHAAVIRLNSTGR